LNARRLQLIAAGVVALAALAGWLRPIPDEASVSASRTAQWRLPARADLERSSAQHISAAQGVVWIGDGVGSAGAGSGVQWTLRGILGGPEPVALVQVGAEPLMKQLKTGDILPDGSRLVAVEEGGVVVERAGCKERRPLYPSAESVDPAPGEACASPGIN